MWQALTRCSPRSSASTAVTNRIVPRPTALPLRLPTSVRVVNLSRLWMPGSARTGHAVLAALQDGTSHFPWWECEGAAEAGAYHLRTRLPGNEVGLLVDPGAHDNLVGANTMARMVEIAQQKGFGSLVRPLATTMQVEGVGKGAQATDTATQVQIGIEGKLGTYTAPTIPDSDLPPLLGLKTLRTYRAILDMSGPEAELILPGPGGFELKLSPGSTRLPLTASASGHLILPVTNYPKPGDGQDSSFTFVSERTAPASRQ